MNTFTEVESYCLFNGKAWLPISETQSYDYLNQTIHDHMSLDDMLAYYDDDL